MGCRITYQNQYVKSKLGSPTDTSKAPYVNPSPLANQPATAMQAAAISPAPSSTPQVSGVDISGGQFSPALGVPSSPTPTSAPASTPAPSVPSSPIVDGNREAPPMQQRGAGVGDRGGSGGGGGGASGKMLYRPQVSQSRITALKSMLGLPMLKGD